jgi:hypothetical protein
MLCCGGGSSTGSGAILRGTRKGLEGLGGLRNTEKGHNDEGIVSFLCMEQSTGAIAYPRKARPPTAWVSWEFGVSS